jgi:hypothetical protein
MACTEKQYSAHLGGVTNIDETIWSNEAKEVKQISLVSNFVQSKSSDNGCAEERKIIFLLFAR